MAVAPEIGIRFFLAAIVLAASQLAAGELKSSNALLAASKGPLAVLPSSPGPTVAKINALGDNAWLELGSPAPDPKWGKARGRAWTPHMAYVPELKIALLMGEGVHSWYNKQTNRYMDDFFAYDIYAHRWVNVRPGTDIKNVSVKMNSDGFEVDDSGDLVPVSQLCHGWEVGTYDTDHKKFLWTSAATQDFMCIFGERRKGYPWPNHPCQCSPWMYNIATDKFEIQKTKGACPVSGNGDIFKYVPSLKKAIFIQPGNKAAWLYDPQANTWTNLSPKGPPPPFGMDAGACVDTKRDRIYFTGGYFPVAPANTNAFWCYDIKTNAWIDLQPKGKPCQGCTRDGQNNAILNYDSVNDAVLLFFHLGPYADPDGPAHPGQEALGTYVYDPKTNSWDEKALPLPKELTTRCPSGFYDPDLNVHFFHCANDCEDNGVMSVYRYKK